MVGSTCCHLGQPDTRLRWKMTSQPLGGISGLKIIRLVLIRLVALLLSSWNFKFPARRHLESDEPEVRHLGSGYGI